MRKICMRHHQLSPHRNYHNQVQEQNNTYILCIMLSKNSVVANFIIHLT